MSEFKYAVLVLISSLRKKVGRVDEPSDNVEKQRGQSSFCVCQNSHVRRQQVVPLGTSLLNQQKQILIYTTYLHYILIYIT